jgi:hypothetical protein
VHLTHTGTATGALSFDSGTGTTRTVTISNITGTGTLGIAIDAGSASDQAGNLAAAAGPSATTLVQAATSVLTGILVRWGSQSMPVQTASDGVRLLPAGRNIDMPWINTNALTITFSQAVTLIPTDVAVTGSVVPNYGPVTISGSGTSYTITLHQAADQRDGVGVVGKNDGASGVFQRKVVGRRVKREARVRRINDHRAAYRSDV